MSVGWVSVGMLMCSVHHKGVGCSGHSLVERKHDCVWDVEGYDSDVVVEGKDDVGRCDWLCNKGLVNMGCG